MGLVFVLLGISVYTYAYAANLPEYVCSDPCTLISSGSSTRTICQNNCPYIGVPSSFVKNAGALIAIFGAILAGIGVAVKEKEMK